MPQAVPGAGWVMAYIELMMHEYRFTRHELLFDLPVEAGGALLEARAARLNPGGTVGWVQRCIVRARDQMRAWLEQHFDILP